jgi:hypothetical protein
VLVVVLLACGRKSYGGNDTFVLADISEDTRPDLKRGLQLSGREVELICFYETSKLRRNISVPSSW